MAAPPTNRTHDNAKDNKYNYVLDNNRESEIRSSSSFNNHTKETPLPLFQRYEFPVLAEDPSSISKARTDPLACNVNNDAVLIWNDVIIHRRDCDALPVNVTSLPEASIEDVYQELQTTVEAYNGASSRISNNDDVDGFDNENMKEHLHDFHRRRHRQNHHHHLKHEDVVVSRRRMFEQGLDLPFISKLTNIENCYGGDHFIDSSASALGCDKFECGENVNFFEHENNSREIIDDFLHFDETKLAKSGNKDCIVDVVDCKKNLNISDVILFESSREDINISNENSSFVFAVENDKNTENKKSYLDSGHFEDISAELLSPNRSSTGSDVFLSSNEYRNCKDDGEEDEQYVSQTEINYVDNHVRGEHNSFHDDSEVFIEDGKENDTTINDSNSLRARNDLKPHRVKFHHKTRSTNRKKQNKTSDKDKIWRDDASITVRCENVSCKNATNLIEARKSYKNCHHCLRTYYCSRGCRREDWKRHKDYGYCHGSRVSSACKKIIRHCNTNPEIKSVLTRLAVRGYLSHGRGCVMLGFPDLESTDEFMEFGFPMLELNPIYVSAKELAVSKMYGNVLEKLLETCKSYKPDVKFVLNVGVGLRFNKEDFLSFSWLHQGNQYCYRNQNHEEVDTFGSLGSDLGYGSLSSNLNTSGKSFSSSADSPKNPCHHCFVFDNYSQRSPSSRHKAPILQNFIKLKLSPLHAQQKHEKRWTFEKHFWDEFRTAGPTLILTGIPERNGADINQSEGRKRELTFINIQRKLRERNVDLRHQYPLVHSHLIAYVTKGVHFPSQVLFPVDSKTGRTFTCFMMPEAEAELEWMQSHHLLNDLELSKDSLSRSLSKSFSSSMPSLYTHSQGETRLTLDASEVTPCPPSGNHDNRVNQKSRSVSFSQLNSLDNDGCYIELSTTPDTCIPISTNKETHGKNYFPEKNVNEMDLETDEKTDKKECRSVEISANMLSKDETATPIPIDIQADRANSKLVANKAQDHCHRRIHDERVCENENKIDEFHWATNQKVTPSYYPVRKARNVKLYSHIPVPSNSPSTESRGKQRRKPWDLSVEITPASLSIPPSSPTALLSTPPTLLSTPPILLSIPPTLLSTPPTLSPALYTSTPKSSHPPVLRDLLSTTSRPSLNINNLSNEIHVVSHNQIAPNNHNDIPIPVNNNYSYCQNCVNSTFTTTNYNISAYSNMDYTCEQNIQNAEKEYGFDSCYRNKVVVDEVDQMKRRRKDRSSKCSMPLLSSFPYSQSSQQNMEYYWFEDGALQSPPLATSTLERSRSRSDGRERNQHCSFKYSKRKAKHKKRESFRLEGNVKSITGDRDDGTYDSCLACDTCPIITNSNDVSWNTVHENTHINCDDDVEGTENIPGVHESRESEPPSADTNINLGCYNDLIDLNTRLSPNFRRKCNTNYFPKDFKMNKSPTSIILHPDNSHDIKGRMNERCLGNGLHYNAYSKDKRHKAKTNTYSFNSERSPPSANHITSNNNIDNDNTMTNSFKQSSPPVLDNTRTVFIPKTSLRNHSNKNAISSTQHRHLRMRIFEDVTHHLANQTPVYQSFADPTSTSSRRKIKFDLPNSDSASKCQDSNATTHRPRHPCARHDRRDKNTVSFNTEFSHETRPDKSLHHSSCHLVPAINMSYSSDW